MDKINKIRVNDVDYELEGKVTVDTELNLTSENPVQNKVIKAELDKKVSTESLTEHTGNTNNPHNVTKEQVGLGNVDNTSDVDKPVSTATQAELDKKADKTEIADMLTKTEASSTYATKEELPEEYTLPAATSEALGGIKVGAGLSILPDGTLSATGGGVADSVEWENVQGKPEFKTVATTGSYNDLTDKPAIPTNVSELTNDSGYITSVPTEYVTDTELGEKGYLTSEEAAETYATKSELSGKQDTLSSGTNIKTINGESLLGSGDIEFSGYKMEEVSDTGEVAKELQPNVFYKFTGEITTLTITFAAEKPGVMNEYVFQFNSGVSPVTLNMPESVKWVGSGEVAASMTYYVSVVSNIGVMGGVSNA